MENRARFVELPCGITRIDTMLHRPGLAACYLLEHRGMAGFIDAGTGNSVPLLMDVLRRKRIDPDAVAYVMPTHVHLDHAGGAGQLMSLLPNARLVMHPRGTRHMVDPSRLQQGSLAVYGEERYRRIFGELSPVQSERIIETDDEFVLDFNGRRLVFLDTPGHARHHYCIYDETARGIFSGDTFGASYAELNQGRRPFIFPPTTPVHFDPEAWQSTLNRLLALDPQRVFVTHFGMLEDVQLMGRLLSRAITDYAEMALDTDAEEPERQRRLARQLLDYSVDTLLDCDCDVDRATIESLLEMDMALNAQGLCHWVDSKDQTGT